jgi:hypothetical protein
MVKAYQMRVLDTKVKLEISKWRLIIMSSTKWLTMTVTEEELGLIDEGKRGMEKRLGVKLSRSAFVKRLLFASVLVEGVEVGSNQ